MSTTPNCAACGRFVNCDEGVVHFTPDSEYTIESVEWLCPPCSDKERERTALQRRAEFCIIA